MVAVTAVLRGRLRPFSFAVYTSILNVMFLKKKWIHACTYDRNTKPLHTRCVHMTALADSHPLHPSTRLLFLSDKKNCVASSLHPCRRKCCTFNGNLNVRQKYVEEIINNFSTLLFSLFNLLPKITNSCTDFKLRSSL